MEDEQLEDEQLDQEGEDVSDEEIAEEESVEDIALDTEARVEALVSLLVKKGLITEEEFEKAYDEQFEDA